MTTLRPSMLAICAVTTTLSIPLVSFADPVVLDVVPSSSYTSGCFPPCLCPIQLVDGMTGTMRFELKESNPLFDTYSVQAEFLVPSDPPLVLAGTGTYTVGGEVAVTQELVLDLASDGRPTERFQSGKVGGAVEFPDRLAISVAIGERQCQDTVLDIVAEPASSVDDQFVRGDCNADGALDISDALTGLVFLFAGGAPPGCSDACDANDDEKLDLSDAVATLSHLFLGVGPLPEPTGTCGLDPSGDALACESFAACGKDCSAEAAAIAAETQIVGSCSAVIRLDYLTRRILGWQLACGSYAKVDEEIARERARADAGYGAGQMLNPPSPADAFVFYEPPGDFGGAGIVSARNRLTLFGGSIVWDGAGEITYPKDWRAPGDLGADCPPFEGEVEIRAYDLAAGAAGLPAEDIAAAMDVARRTAIFDGLSRSGYVFDVLVVLYPRSVGAFDPATAELVVIVNGGWLE